MTTGEDIKNEHKVAIPLDFFYIIPSSNYKISCPIVSLIMHDGDSLDCGHYGSGVFDTNTGIWWHCDDENITQIGDSPEGGYIRESPPQKCDVRIKRYIVCGLYQNKPSDKIQLCFFFKNSPTLERRS